MQRLEVSGAVQPLYGSLGVKMLILNYDARNHELKILGETTTPFLLLDKIPYGFQALLST